MDINQKGVKKRIKKTRIKEIGDRTEKRLSFRRRNLTKRRRR